MPTCKTICNCVLLSCRPHPWAPNKPPLNIAASAAVTPLDFMRDLVAFGGAIPM
jgi:hypothetical protein